MQSLLQYRRFGEAVKAQQERDRHKAEAIVRGYRNSVPGHQDSSSSLPSNGEEKGFEEIDLEKADHHHGPSSPEGTESSNDDDANRDEDLHAQLSRLATAQTKKSQQTALGVALTGIHVRQRSTREGGTGKVFVVGYESDTDPLNPHNWSKVKRFAVTFLVAGIGFVVGVASSIDSSALTEAAQEFGVSEVVESMATGLYLIGFGVGALFAGPISETLGRNPVYISTLLLYMIFIMASGLAPNIGAQLAFRFLAGFFGSTPLTCAGGSISDLWNPLERVYAFPIFANAAFTGPVLGPVIGGFIAQSSLVSWRWTEWITLIMSGLVLGLVVLFQPETYPGVLMKWKAAHLRKVTGDDRYRAEMEIREDTFLSRLRRALYRPFLLTFREPIIMLIALYLTVVYIILFTFFDGYDYIFTEIHHTSQGVTGLCFAGIAVGLFGASALVPLIYRWARRDLEKVRARGGDRLPPEFRLWFSMLGAPAITISLFWMGWTSDSSISIWSPLAASVLFGYGILCVFISSYQYIIDSYETYAASALASVTLIRYMAAGGMTIVGIPMYENLGVHYTLTVLGCISAVLVPVPYLFFKYGTKIRKHSKYAINPV
ncbi:MAG: hypothetical protein M1820_004918 [Bogoriella megaspora]|nr:MAG: hypothetical protein M1820_004918 [Bogoriella megaspora]